MFRLIFSIFSYLFWFCLSIRFFSSDLLLLIFYNSIWEILSITFGDSSVAKMLSFLTGFLRHVWVWSFAVGCKHPVLWRFGRTGSRNSNFIWDWSQCTIGDLISKFLETEVAMKLVGESTSWVVELKCLWSSVNWVAASLTFWSILFCGERSALMSHI